jgi:hypothetical protein
MTKKYMTEPWFPLLADACRRMPKKDVALALGVSAPVVSQAMNGSGKYGSGEASTEKLALKVMHTFGQYACPHLSEQSTDGQPVEITAEQCRGYAHRPAPTGSARDMRHWQACNTCPHKALTAPPAPREVKPRKREEIAPTESQR